MSMPKCLFPVQNPVMLTMKINEYMSPKGSMVGLISLDGGRREQRSSDSAL